MAENRGIHIPYSVFQYLQAFQRFLPLIKSVGLAGVTDRKNKYRKRVINIILLQLFS